MLLIFYCRCDKYSNCLPGNARVVKNCTIFSPTVCDGCAEGSFFDPNLGMNGGCTECSAPCGVFEVETRACKTEHDRKCTPARQKKKEIPTLISSKLYNVTLILKCLHLAKSSVRAFFN